MEHPYLYADGTPFPLASNFIDLLRDAVECAVQLLRISERAAGAREIAVQAEERSSRAIEDLSALEEAVARAAERVPSTSEQVGTRIREATARAVADEKALLTAELAGRKAAVDRETAG